MKEALSGGTDRSDSGNSYSEFSGYIAERVMEHYEDEMIAQEDIVIDRIYHGHFSSVDTDEIFVLCKISNTSHVAGLDKTVAVLLEADSLGQIAYGEFHADQVEISRIPASNRRSKLLYRNNDISGNSSTGDTTLGYSE